MIQCKTENNYFEIRSQFAVLYCNDIASCLQYVPVQLHNHLTLCGAMELCLLPINGTGIRTNYVLNLSQVEGETLTSVRNNLILRLWLFEHFIYKRKHTLPENTSTDQTVCSTGYQLHVFIMWNKVCQESRIHRCSTWLAWARNHWSDKINISTKTRSWRCSIERNQRPTYFVKTV